MVQFPFFLAVGLSFMSFLISASGKLRPSDATSSSSSSSQSELHRLLSRGSRESFESSSSFNFNEGSEQQHLPVEVEESDLNEDLGGLDLGEDKQKQLADLDVDIVASSTDRWSISSSSMFQVNALMFFFYLTLGSAMPYIPLYYRNLGVPDAHIGILGAIAPTINFIVSPLWGAYADSKGNQNKVMLVTFVLSVLVRYTLRQGQWVYPLSPGEEGEGSLGKLWLLGSIVAVTAVLNAPVKPLMDSAVLNMLPESQKSSYGKSRFYGQVGFGLGSYLVGPLIQTNMKRMFDVHLLVAIPTTVLMLAFNRSARQGKEKKRSIQQARAQEEGWVWSKKPKGKSLEKFREAWGVITADKSVVIFFFVVFLVGVSSGVIENFAYMRISEVCVGGKDKNVLGKIRLISSIAGGPMFWLSGRISKAIGVYGILLLSLASYTARFIIYANISNAYQALPAEFLRGLVFAVFWAGSTFHVYSISTKGTVATMLAVLNAVYAGLGQSLGSLVGGFLTRRMGSIAEAFRLCGLIDFAILLLFGAYVKSTFKSTKMQAVALKKD